MGSWQSLLRVSRHHTGDKSWPGGERDIAWTPNGRRFAGAAADGWVVMWDLRTGREVLSLKANTAQVKSIAISPDGLRIATMSVAGNVKLWNMQGRQLLAFRHPENGCRKIAWSADGVHLASDTGDGPVQIRSAPEWNSKD